MADQTKQNLVERRATALRAVKSKSLLASKIAHLTKCDKGPLLHKPVRELAAQLAEAEFECGLLKA